MIDTICKHKINEWIREITMKENIEKIKEILKENVNIIELDTLIEELRKSKYLNDLL